MTARVNWRVWHLAPDHAVAEFLRVLREASEAYAVDILGFVIMSNHFHFVCRMPPAAIFHPLTSRPLGSRRLRPWPRGHVKSTVIGQFMHNVMRRTAVSLQRALELSGHFWEQRYHARRLLDATDFLTALAYDHMNPVEQGMASHAEAYDRSSAAWWSAGGTSPIPLLRMPPPFEATVNELRERLLKYQSDKQFLREFAELETRGLRPGSAEWREHLSALVRDHGLPESS